VSKYQSIVSVFLLVQEGYQQVGQMITIIIYFKSEINHNIKRDDMILCSCEGKNNLFKDEFKFF